MAHSLDATTFLHCLARAERATAEKNWSEAVVQWAEIVATNPVDGRYWRRLAEARQETGNLRGAIEAEEQAFTLGHHFPAETAYRIATFYAQLRETAPAQSWFDRAWSLGYRHSDQARDDDDLSLLREDEPFRTQVGLIGEKTLPRDDGWQFDLQF